MKHSSSFFGVIVFLLAMPLEAHGLHSTGFINEIVHASGGWLRGLLILLIGFSIAVVRFYRRKIFVPAVLAFLLGVIIGIIVIVPAEQFIAIILPFHAEDLTAFPCFVQLALLAIGFICGEIINQGRHRVRAYRIIAAILLVLALIYIFQSGHPAAHFNVPGTPRIATTHTFLKRYSRKGRKFNVTSSSPGSLFKQ